MATSPLSPVSTSTTSKTPATTDVSATPGAAVRTTPVDIGSLEQKYGWAAGSWQDKLLRAADSTSRSPDGKMTASKLDAYLADPKDLQFVTSSDMLKMQNEVSSHGNTLSVGAFKSSFEHAAALKADTNGDGKLTDTELNNYLTQIKTSSGKDFPTWLPDMEKAVYDDKIASVTGETDPFAVTSSRDPNFAAQGPDLSENFEKIQTDPKTRVPDFVTYQLSAADIAEQEAGTSRKGLSFHADPNLVGTPGAVNPKDYSKSPFDLGHMRPALDSPNQQAMAESFTTANAATQTHVLNRQSWRCVEGAVHELVAQTGGTATIVTGNLFLDSKGNPLPPDRRPTYQPPNGDPPLAVPTECFKAVLLTLPDGSHQMFAYAVPNRSDLPTTEAGYQPILRASRVSVDQIEKGLGGTQLFADTGIPPAQLSQMEADSTSTIIDPAVAKTLPHGKVLWGPTLATPPAPSSGGPASANA